MSYIGNAPTTAAFLVDTFSGTGSQTAFTMTVAPANTSSILVSITGVVQDPSTYSVSGTTLTFSAAPPSGTSNISVRYLGIPASGVTTTAYRTVTEFTATSGQTSFSVPSYTVGYIDVYRNGVMLGTADYTATTGTTVVLGTGATTGDLIRTESFYVSSVLNAIPNSPASVGSSNLSSNLTLGGTTTATTITAPASTALTLQANNGTTGLTVNTNGMVSTPLRPAFFMSGNGGTIATGQVIPWNVTITNIGSYFNTSTYRFVAPIAGVYVFTLYGIMGVTGANTQAEIFIRKNGTTTLADMHRNASSSYITWEQGSVTVVVSLAVNDYIDTYTYSGTIYLDSGVNYSGFSGYLLS